MIDSEEIRRKWEKDRPYFERFGRLIVKHLAKEVQRRGISATVSSRAKDIDSLIKKLIRKPQYSYETLGDKSGVRVIVRYRQEIAVVVGIARQLFICGKPEDTAERLAEDQVGYLSTHMDLAFKPQGRGTKQYASTVYRAELQVRTLAQHLWSEMSHDTTYKSGGVVESDLKRRVYLLAGLIEVADREFSRLEEEFSRMEIVAEVKLLKALESQYFKLTSRRGDTDLSLDVIRILWPLYEMTPDQIRSHLDRMFAEKTDVLKAVLDDADRTHRERSAFLFQPEVLMIFDLLHSRQYDLRRAWGAHYPERELERLANAFGMSFD